MTVYRLAKTVILHHSNLLSAFVFEPGNLIFILYQQRGNDKPFSMTTIKIVNYERLVSVTFSFFCGFFQRNF